MIKIDVCHDETAGVYIATSDRIGLALEAESLDGLMQEVHAAMPVLLDLTYPLVDKTRADIRLHENFAPA